ncbi:uncharacterized protein [Nicotiana sylvestris]|uniref:uncharacterized protein n=1 Tax=Nicotiana sylvestris TaxID=4096 RepID=UPI00388C9CF4
MITLKETRKIKTNRFREIYKILTWFLLHMILHDNIVKALLRDLMQMDRVSLKMLKVWMKLYKMYSTKLQKEEKVGSRRAETKRRSGKNRYEPYMGPAGKDSRPRQDNQRFLQSEVDNLLKQGYLTELFTKKSKEAYMKNRQVLPKPPSPKRTVNVISGGEDINCVTCTASNKVSKVTITYGKRVRQVLEEEIITFDDADADGVLCTHNDALVISLLVHDTNTKRVLIDPGSSVNIILLRVLREMQAEDKMIPKAHTLSEFDNSSVVTKGEVILMTFAECVIKDTKFQVVDMEMAYNMILGRPWIHEMDVVPSTLHQVIKFPSPWGIFQICRDQHAARNINSVTDTSTINEEK